MLPRRFGLLPADPDTFVFWGTTLLTGLYLLVSPFLS
jgi:hypothetical protein